MADIIFRHAHACGVKETPCPTWMHDCSRLRSRFAGPPFIRRSLELCSTLYTSHHNKLTKPRANPGDCHVCEPQLFSFCVLCSMQCMHRMSLVVTIVARLTNHVQERRLRSASSPRIDGPCMHANKLGQAGLTAWDAREITLLRIVKARRHNKNATCMHALCIMARWRPQNNAVERQHNAECSPWPWG